MKNSILISALEDILAEMDEELAAHFICAPEADPMENTRKLIENLKLRAELAQMPTLGLGYSDEWRKRGLQNEIDGRSITLPDRTSIGKE